MTICYFSAQYLPTVGGVERYTWNLARCTVAAGHRAIVVTSALPNLPEHEIDGDGIEIYRLPVWPVMNGRFPVIKPGARFHALTAQIWAQKPDFCVVQTRMYTQSVWAARAAKRRGIPMLVIDHSTGYMPMGNGLLGACGRLWTPEGPCREPEEILAECGRMSAPAAEGFFAALTRENARPAGERLYVETGERGVRGEAAGSFPAVLKIGLPALRAALDQGAGLEEAGTAALLALTAGTADTNLFARGGMEGQRWAVRHAGALLEVGPRPDPEAVRALDRAMIQRNLSPGGCADLLAITYFLYFMQGK